MERGNGGQNKQPGKNPGGNSPRKNNGESTSTTRPETTGGPTGDTTGNTGEKGSLHTLPGTDMVGPKPTEIILPGGETASPEPKKRGPKPGSKRTPSKESNSVALSVGELTETVKPLLYAGFGMAASRFGEHWNITETEAQSIAEPTARIMKRFENIEFIEKYMDYIALTVALGGAIGSRVIQGKEITRKEDKPVEQPKPTATVTPINTERKTSGSDRPSPASDSSHVSGGIKESIPSMAY